MGMKSKAFSTLSAIAVASLISGCGMMHRGSESGKACTGSECECKSKSECKTGSCGEKGHCDKSCAGKKCATDASCSGDKGCGAKK